jgi:hypothetical protein
MCCWALILQLPPSVATQGGSSQLGQSLPALAVPVVSSFLWGLLLMLAELGLWGCSSPDNELNSCSCLALQICQLSPGNDVCAKGDGSNSLFWAVLRIELGLVLVGKSLPLEPCPQSQKNLVTFFR